LTLYIKLREKLTEDQRATLLKPLFENGWSVTQNRDALYKEYNFKDFIEVYRLFFINFPIFLVIRKYSN
jgi:hypothetical protein